jgi:hypothetical protein
MNENVIDVLQRLIIERKWGLEFSKEAIKDLRYYEKTGLAETILAAILEGHNNPLLKEDGGTGIFLGKDQETGDGRPALYWKLRSIGIRIVYGLEPPIMKGDKVIKKKNILVLVIGNRRNKEVYHTAVKRLTKYRKRLSGPKHFKP